jgi:hypothetical protein
MTGLEKGSSTLAMTAYNLNRMPKLLGWAAA